jgi:hypothetical protein
MSEDLDKQFTKLDLKDYQLPKDKGESNLKKNQRLALEIIKWCEIPVKFQGFWWRQVKNFTEFTEDRFNELKRRGIKNTKYLKKLIFK